MFKWIICFLKCHICRTGSNCNNYVEVTRINDTDIRIDIITDGSRAVWNINANWLLQAINNVGFKLNNE